MKYVNDKRGFTLVELLAVIVILALIMGIAAFSMQGVTENVRISSIKSSAMTYVEGLRNLLLSNMNITEGDYYINEIMLQKEINSPWGDYVYYTGTDTTITNNLNSRGFSAAGETLHCGGANQTGSFVRISKAATGNYTYAVCLYDDANNYVFAHENVLQKDDAKSDYYMSNVETEVYIDANGKITTTEPTA